MEKYSDQFSSSRAMPTMSGSATPTALTLCFHCGTPCRDGAHSLSEKAFCCNGCLTVFELLTANGLTDFYNFAENAGVRVKASIEPYTFLDESTVRERLVNFSGDNITKVTFRIPSIHCIACVWLLENLFRLKDGIGQSQVHFPRKEVSITFHNDKVKLSEVVSLLASLGYEPDLKFSDLEAAKTPISRRLWLQLGIAGFAFGNIMLLSISSYLGLDDWGNLNLKKLFGYISFALALPVFFYSASDYWKAAWTSARRKLLTIEVPIAVGIVALFGQSVYEFFSGRGEGYFDSLCGLLFFLLCGKLFQQKTFDRLAFDRDFKSFFPLSVTRKNGTVEERVALSQLAVGDHLLIRNGELIPADAKLISGPALIDYSFVTGEAEPSARISDDHLYAGGRQIGGAIEVEIVKAVSQSYLTSLWNQEVFSKEKVETLHTLTNVFSYRFTKIILAIAFGAALFWSFADPSRAVKSFAAVLIVACPCALALAAPFALGTAQRVLARRNIFLKNPTVIENLAKVDSIVFDKTGTLTAAGAGSIHFRGEPLTFEEQGWIGSLTRHSTHPYSVRVSELLSSENSEIVRSFSEKAGCGIEGLIAGNEIWMGSAAWLESKGVATEKSSGSTVHIAINGKYRGRFDLTSALRTGTDQLLRNLSAHYELALLSGDNEKERARFTELFGEATPLHFNQSPLHKFEFVEQLRRGERPIHPQNSDRGCVVFDQSQRGALPVAAENFERSGSAKRCGWSRTTQPRSKGKTVMMVGDGLNDAGALRKSDVGVAVVENISAFSPASDIILNAKMVPHLDEVLRFSKSSVRIVKLSFLISTLYNVVGVSIAASGNLSPVVCAILMPVSSISVVAFACGVTTWFGNRTFRNCNPQEDQNIAANEDEKASLLTSSATRIVEAA